MPVQLRTVRVAALVPVKRFEEAKGRLAKALNAEDRIRLAQWMATGVVHALAEIDVFIACDDPGVRDWAVSLDANIVWGPGLGLNGAIDDGVKAISARGFDHVLISHADIPRPSPLRHVARRNMITLVPDRRRDGTNVISFPLAHPIRAQYGAGSFARHLVAAHLVAAQTTDLGVDVRDDADLSLDIDTPDDLTHPLIDEVLPTWLQTNLANRP